MRKIYLQNGEYYGLTDMMTGKMTGMWSLNTSPSANPFCQKMQKNPKYICKSCYSRTSEARWKGAGAAWAHNSAVLGSRRLGDSEVPDMTRFKVMPDIFRFSAHGDLMNETHYKNLILIAKANPQVMFALWTKRAEIVRKVGNPRLTNMLHIYSTPVINKFRPIKPRGFDKVFTVYTRPFVRANGIEINCGARECLTCRLCYTHNSIVWVNELIKANGYKGGE